MDQLRAVHSSISLVLTNTWHYRLTHNLPYFTRLTLNRRKIIVCTKLPSGLRHVMIRLCQDLCTSSRTTVGSASLACSRVTHRHHNAREVLRRLCAMECDVFCDVRCGACQERRHRVHGSAIVGSCLGQSEARKGQCRYGVSLSLGIIMCLF